MSTKNRKRASDLIDNLAGHISFGEVLHSLRVNKGLTQKEMAEHLEITRQELSNIENGHKSVSVEKAVTFAKKLRHPQKIFAKYVLQDQLHRAGLKVSIEIRNVA